MRRFEVIDGERRGEHVCGVLSYDPVRDCFRFEPAVEALPEDMPAMFAPFVKQGKEIPSRWVRAWVDERIAPPSRQNIGEVLRANGLVTYDPVTLLAAGEGRSTQDGFYLREVGDGVRGGRELGIHLAAARERAGMTQEELARRSGVSQDNISLFERGGGNPTVRTLERLARGMGTRLQISFKEDGLTDENGWS